MQTDPLDPTPTLAKPCTAFEANRLLRTGPLIEVALAIKNAEEFGATGPILVFEDATGRGIDFDLRGTKADIIARLSQIPVEGKRPPRPPSDSSPVPSDEAAPEARGRGRPKLGVVGREVTLLPRHWEWLAAQPGGPSVTLRKLIDEARRSGGTKQQRRAACDAAYRFMSAMAGNLPGFEEATRALYADDRARFDQQVADWPADIRAYAVRLAYAETVQAVHPHCFGEA